MAETPEEIRKLLDALVHKNARGRLIARGLARGMIWRNGVVPDGGPEFPENLSDDLLDFGYGVLASALELRDANQERNVERHFPTQDAFTVAAEAIESAVRRGDSADPHQGRHLVVSAAAFHLAGYAARSYSLLPSATLKQNLSSAELALGLLLRRDLVHLRDHVVRWFSNPAHSDDAITARLKSEDDDFGPEDATIVALSALFFRALGLTDTALLFGDRVAYESATVALEQTVKASGDAGNIPIWWMATLAAHLVRDLWDQCLHTRLPTSTADDMGVWWEFLRDNFIAQLGVRRPPHIDLWPSQLAAAARAVDPTDDLVVALPTSAGKTRIAELCILRALADGRRAVYVTPLRALSAQVERVLARTFIPLHHSVTSLYGAIGATTVDTKTLIDADIVVATPEKLDFALRQDPRVLNDVSLIVFDEGHMIGLGSREIRYEVLIQSLLRRSDAASRRIVCLSAMFNPDDPYFKDFGQWLRSDEPGESVHVRWRPTRQRLATLNWNQSNATALLNFIEGEEAFVPRFLEGVPPHGKRRKLFPANEVEFCISASSAFARDGHNVLLYSPQRSQIEPLVREFRRMHKQGNLPDIKIPAATDLKYALAIGREWLGEDHPAVEGLEIGVGTHHGALPRPFLTAVEELLARKQLSIVVASPTLAQGIDLSCSVLIFRSLTRFDIESKKHKPITPAEFSNVVGRAGRAYVDLDGIAVIPCFEAGRVRNKRHKIFKDLVENSKGLRLRSGLALLILELINRICIKLGVEREHFFENVLGQVDVWSDTRLSDSQEADEEDDATRTLEEYVADLDVALLSLIDRLDAPPEDLAILLDDVLKDSLWKRTLAHAKVKQPKLPEFERQLLISRAEWLWSSSSIAQRKACFSSGLGKKPGVFLYDHLDELVQLLADFQQAVVAGDSAAAGARAVSFAEKVMVERFFSANKRPDDWPTVLTRWVAGESFADILAGRPISEQQSTQAFVQDGVVFKLVWAAEAVRVQANVTEHSRADELGDGPTFALTFGVPTIPAALLCQMGFASRVGALWATHQLSASFNDVDSMRAWIREHDTLLSDQKFWESDDQWFLWRDATMPSFADRPQPWERREHSLIPDWLGEVPAPETRIRLIPRSRLVAAVCAIDLSILGSTKLPLPIEGASVDASVMEDGSVKLNYYGPTV